MLRLALPLLALCLGTTTQDKPKEAPKYDMKVLQLVFLVTPEKAPQIGKEDAEAKQREHLQYLEGLWRDRKALLVGPLEEAGRLRGLVVLDVESKDKAEEIMRQDPWVKAGQLAIETRPWFAARNVPQKAPNFLDLEPLWFGLLKRPADAPTHTKEELEKIQAGHMANIQKMAASGDLVLAGPMAEPGELRGIFIFRTPSRERVLELAADDPAIQQRRLTLELFRWHTAKGTFPQP